MKWIFNNIKIISFFWWLIQGILLLLNEIRCLLEFKRIVIPETLVTSICLIVISFFLLVKNNKIILFFSIVLFLYSIASLIILTWVGLIATVQNDWVWLFLLIPVMGILLSILLMKEYIKINNSNQKII